MSAGHVRVCVRVCVRVRVCGVCACVRACVHECASVWCGCVHARACACACVYVCEGGGRSSSPCRIPRGPGAGASGGRALGEWGGWAAGIRPGAVVVGEGRAGWDPLLARRQGGEGGTAQALCPEETAPSFQGGRSLHTQQVTGEQLCPRSERAPHVSAVRPWAPPATSCP